MDRPVRDFIAGVLAAAVCAYAVFQGLQVVAIFSLTILIAMIYKRIAIRVVGVGLELLRATRQAKYGSFEIQIQRELRDISAKLEAGPQWLKLIAPTMDESQVGLLLAIHKQGKYQIHSGSVREVLRSLRSKGLVAHDDATLAQSSFATLTELGMEVAECLRALSLPGKDSDAAQSGPA